MNDRDTPSKRHRREHSPMFKRELVARSLIPGASVAAIALEAGINSNLLFAWRRIVSNGMNAPTRNGIEVRKWRC